MNIVRPDLLDQPMTRAEFLKNIGVGAVLLLGGGMFLQLFGNIHDVTKQGASRAYGINTYGGQNKQSGLQ